MNYYNDHDPYAAAWLRTLIVQGLIPPGEVDSRSILDVHANDLLGFTQCHFFAGIGGWPHALDLARWPRTRPVWTASCPCQPFSGAGLGEVDKDERHLWPAFRELLAERKPPACFGEQVASSDGRIWLAGVRADLEKLGYVCGGADLCAAGIGAPHIRQRLFWVAHPVQPRLEGFAGHGDRGHEPGRLGADPAGSTAARGPLGGLGDAERAERGTHSQEPASGQQTANVAGDAGAADGDAAGGLGHAHGGWIGGGDQRRPRTPGDEVGEPKDGPRAPDEPRHGREDAGAAAGFWGDFELIACRDGKARRIEPGSFPLAHGVSGRVAIRRPHEQPGATGEETREHWYNRTGALRGVGNAIVPPLAALFVQAAEPLIGT